MAVVGLLGQARVVEGLVDDRRCGNLRRDPGESRDEKAPPELATRAGGEEVRPAGGTRCNEGAGARRRREETVQNPQAASTISVISVDDMASRSAGHSVSPAWCRASWITATAAFSVEIRAKDRQRYVGAPPTVV